MSPSRFPVAWFFVLLLAVQSMRTGLFIYSPASFVPRVFGPYLASPSLLGLLMILWLQGLPGIHSVLHKLIFWAAGRAWPMLAVCVLLPLACLPLAVVLLAASGAPVPSLSRISLSAYFYAAFIGKGFLGPGMYEEIGWRGFALPRLQRRYSALVSSVIIGIVWGLWHFPMFVYQCPFPWALALFVVQAIVYSVIFTWAYNTTGGNLLAMILLHGAINARQYLLDWHALPNMATTQILSEMPFLLIAVGILWWYGPSNLSRCERIQAPPPERLNRTAESGPVQAQTSTST
jgi:uncharacterized protein